MATEKVIGLRIQLNGVDKVVSSVKELENELKLAKEDLEDIGVNFGTSSQSFIKLKGEIGNTEKKLYDLRKATETIKPNQQIEAWSRLAAGITSGIAAATAAVNLFGADSEESAKAAAEAQQILTIALAARDLEQIKVGLSTVATTVATKAATAANALETTSVFTLNGALKALYTTIAANPYGAILAGVGLLVGAFVALSSATDEEAESQKELNDALTVGKAKTLEQTVVIDNLKKTILDTTKSETQRNIALDEYKKIIPSANKLTLESKNLVSELNEKTKEYKTTLGLVIIAEQTKELAVKKAQIADELNNKTLQDEIKWYDYLLNLNNPLGAFRGAEISALTRLTEKRAEANAQAQTALDNYIKAQQEADAARKAEEERLRKIAEAEAAVEKARQAAIANEKRRTELIQGELSKRLAQLRDAYKQERYEAQKNGEDLSLVDAVYFKNRREAIESYKQQYLSSVNDLYTKLNELTVGSYLIEEKNLQRQQAAQRKALKEFQDELIKNDIAIAMSANKVFQVSTKEFEDRIKELSQVIDANSPLDKIFGKAKVDELAKQAQKMSGDYLTNLTNLLEQERQSQLKSQEKQLQNAQQANKKALDLQKTLSTSKINLQNDFNQVQIDQETLFQAQINDLRIRKELEGLKSIDDLNKKSNLDDLQSSLDVYNKEYDLFVENEKRKIRAALEIKALTSKEQGGLGLTDPEQIKAEVDKALEYYAPLFETIKRNGQTAIIAQKEIATATKLSAAEQYEEQVAYYTYVKELQEKYKDDQKTLQEKIKVADLAFAADRLMIEKELVQKKIEILEKDPTLNAEELKKLKLQLLQIEVDYANKTAEITDKQVEKSANGFSKRTNKMLEEFQKGLEVLSKSLSDIAAIVAQSFQFQLDNLSAAYEEQLSQVAEVEEKRANETEKQYVERTKYVNQKRLELEKEYQAEKKAIEKEAQLTALKFTLAQSLASAAQAIIGAFATYGASPAAFVIAAITAGITAAQVAIISEQISLVQNSKRRGGLLAGGGLVEGPSHEQGGVYAGGGFVLEGNEAVINRQSTLKYAGLLSQINESGGGRPITIQAPMDSRLVEALAKQNSEPIRAYVVESDISKAQAINKRLEQLASF